MNVIIYRRGDWRGGRNADVRKTRRFQEAQCGIFSGRRFVSVISQDVFIMFISESIININISLYFEKEIDFYFAFHHVLSYASLSIPYTFWLMPRAFKLDFSWRGVGVYPDMGINPNEYGM